MTREEQINQKAKELGQKYFPDENNIWARPNYEAQYVESACKEMIEWDDKKKKLEKIEQNPAWSEYDELIISKIENVLNVQECFDGATGIKMNPYKDALDWLKSLKDRLQPKRELSEDDKKMLESIIYDFGKGRLSTTSQDNWLKSLAHWSIPKIRFV